MAVEYTFTSAEMSKMQEAHVKADCRGAVSAGKAVETGWYLYFDVTDEWQWDGVPRALFNNGGFKEFVRYENRFYHIVESASSRGGYAGFTYPTKSPAPAKKVAYTFTQADIDSFNVDSVSGYIDGVSVVADTIWYQEDTLRLDILKDDFAFEFVQVVTVEGVTVPFNLSNGNKIATLTADTEYQAISFDSVFTPFVAYTVTQKSIDDWKASGVTGSINGEAAKVGDLVHVGDEIKFNLIDVANYQISTASVNYGANKNKAMTVSVDKLSATITWELRETINSFKILVDNVNPIVYRHSQTNEDYFVARHVSLWAEGKKVGLNGDIRRNSIIEIRCNAGFIFTSATPKIVTTDMFTGEERFTDMTVNSDRTIASHTYQTSTLIDRFTFETESDVFYAYTVTQNSLNDFATYGVRGYINNTAMQVGDTISINDDIKFTIVNTAKTSFDSVIIQHSGGQTPMTISVDGYTATHRWVDRTKISKFLFNIKGLFPVVYTHTSDGVAYFNNANASLYANGRLIGLNGTILKGDTIEIRCNPEYEFTTGTSVKIMSYISYNMDVSENRKSATFLWNYEDEIYTFEFFTVKTSTVETDTSNNTYILTPREFRKLESLELREWNTEGVVINDYTTLLVGVMRFPFLIPENDKGNVGGIYLGHKQFNEVQGTEVLDDFITIDLGKIKVEPTFNDLRDYQNTTAILRLPHLSSVNLDLEYVINQEIGVKYYVNLNNGETIVTVESSAVDSQSKTILTLNAILGTQMPIAHKEGNAYKPLDVGNTRLGGDNNVFKPTIDIVRNDQVNGDSMFTIPVKDSGKLTDFKGWTKIDDIVMTLNATQREKQEIIALLKSGVFFNVD